MQSKAEDILKTFAPRKIIWPVLIGLAAATFLFLRNFDKHAFEQISWTWNASFWLFLALLAVVVRDCAYMYRIRVLTDKHLSWKQSFSVIMLWEFASALAPPILGGGFGFAILILSKEKVKTGKSIAVVLFSSFLDGIFFAVMAPVIYLMVGHAKLFGALDAPKIQAITGGKELFYTFWGAYALVLIYKLVVAYALFINPRSVKWLLVNVFSLPVLRKWRHNATETANELSIASRQLKGKNLMYWIRSLGGTFVSWTARYIIVNCIVKAFTQGDVSHFILYARQVVMGLIMLVSPTPGGSGVAEFLFSDLLGEFIPHGLSSSLALLWRIMSYYPYLIIGAIILPRWVRKVFGKSIV